MIQRSVGYVEHGLHHRFDRDAIRLCNGSKRHIHIPDVYIQCEDMRRIPQRLPRRYNLVLDTNGYPDQLPKCVLTSETRINSTNDYIFRLITGQCR